MTRKDYIKLAAAIKATQQHVCVDNTMEEGWHAGISALQIRIEDILRADNERFDRGRFMQACEA